MRIALSTNNPRKISLTVARVAKVLEIQGFTSYFVTIQ